MNNRIQMYVQNNVCLVKDDGSYNLASIMSSNFSAESSYFKMRKGQKAKFVSEMLPLYQHLSMNGELYYSIPRGLLGYLPDQVFQYIDIHDTSTSNITYPSDISYSEVAEILQPDSGFNLRKDQVYGVLAALSKKRGILQYPTAAGKTEIMSGILKILNNYNSNLKALVTVPTTILRNDTSSRFNKYGLSSTPYNDTRMNTEDHSIYVATTGSLLNDLKKNPDLLKEFNVIIKDECQHSKSESLQQLEKYLPNVEYNIGMTALAVDKNKVDAKSVLTYNYTEAMIVGTIGPVIVDVPFKYYIDNGILARPVVFQMYTEAIMEDEEHGKNWSKVQAEILTSDDRTKLLSDVTNEFYKHDRKILILVNTKRLGNKLATDMINHYPELDGKIGLRYGGGSSLEVVNGKIVSIEEDSLDKFGRDELSIIIATSVLDEGVDIKNLDVLIMATAGRGDRRVIQRCGRVLRKTKNGKYAYIVDFSDTGPTMLSGQSSMRMKLYKDLIGIEESYIYPSMSLDRLDYEFTRLEGLR